jgi:hypothetical protein
MALVEGIAGDTQGLTPEQIEAKEAELLRRLAEHAANRDPEEKRATAKKTKAKARVTRKYACDACDSVFANSHELNIHNTTRKHINRASGVDRVVKAPKYKNWASANVAAKLHYCKICDHSFSTRAKLDIHLGRQKHIDKAAAAKSTKSSS